MVNITFNTESKVKWNLLVIQKKGSDRDNRLGLDGGFLEPRLAKSFSLPLAHHPRGRKDGLVEGRHVGLV